MKRITIDIDDLVWDLAWGLKHNRWRLPEAARKGRIKLDFETCLAIAKLQVENMKENGLIEAVREIHDWHSFARGMKRMAALMDFIYYHSEPATAIWTGLPVHTRSADEGAPKCYNQSPQYAASRSWPRPAA